MQHTNGQDNGYNLGLCTAFHACSRWMQPQEGNQTRYSILSATEARLCNSQSKVPIQFFKKTINIVVSPIRRLYSFHILNRPAELLKADQITKHYLPGATSPAGCTEPLSSDTYVWKLKCKMFSNCLDFLLQKILDYCKRNCVPSKCKLLEVRMWSS